MSEQQRIIVKYKDSAYLTEYLPSNDTDELGIVHLSDQVAGLIAFEWMRDKMLRRNPSFAPDVSSLRERLGMGEKQVKTRRYPVRPEFETTMKNNHVDEIEIAEPAPAVDIDHPPADYDG